MKKTRLILACLAVVAVLGGMTGCMLPDFQLNLDVYATNTNGLPTGPTDSTQVAYTFTNVGSMDLSNVQVGIEVWRFPTAGGAASITNATLGPFSIDVSSSQSGTTSAFTWVNDGVDSSFDVYVTSVGWDNK